MDTKEGIRRDDVPKYCNCDTDQLRLAYASIELHFILLEHCIQAL